MWLYSLMLSTGCHWHNTKRCYSNQPLRWHWNGSFLFSSTHSRITSYHFAATRTVICVHASYFVRYRLVLQSPIFLYSPTGQLLFELKVQLHHPKSSNTRLAARHPDPTPLASCTGQVFTLRCKSMKQINPAFSCFPLQNSSYPQFAQLKWSGW